jgi:ubiquitin-conjugating enzyme E2 D/E
MMTPQKLNAMKILTEEYKKLANDPSTNFGITVGLPNEDNIFEWRCTILGPKDTCYKGGIFFLKITFPFDYPNSKPEIVFLTPIYHLNVLYAANQKQPLGHICVNTLNEWKPGDSIIRILPQVFALLNKNNPDSPYDDHLNSRKNEFVNNRPLFNKKAEYFTKKYAYSNDKIIEYKNGWDFTYK